MKGRPQHRTGLIYLDAQNKAMAVASKRFGSGGKPVAIDNFYSR
jgi:hypothetical protein